MSEAASHRSDKPGDEPAPVSRSSQSTTRISRVSGLILISAALVIGFHHATLVQFFCDDSYMPYRFAQNLIEGKGLVFNPGEMIEGYTNFLWILILAAGMGAGLSPELWSLIAGSGCLLLLGSLVVHVTRQICSSWMFGATALVLLASTGPVILWSLSGMESGCFTATVLLALVLYHRAVASPVWLALSGVLYALASMIRPDGCIFGAVAGLHLMLSLIAGRNSIRISALRCAWLAGGYFAVMLPFMIWRITYYGDWLPNTFYVKTGSSIQWELGIAYLRAFGEEYPFLWIGTWIGIGLALTHSAYRKHIPLVSHLALAALGYGLYVARIGGDYMALYRFTVPVLPMAVVFTTMALHALSLAIPRRTPNLALLRTLAGFAVLAGLSWWLHQPSYASAQGRVANDRVNSQQAMSSNTDRWIKVGKALNRRLWPDARIATTATGALAFHARAYTLDQTGLTDRHTAKVESDPWRLHVPGHMKQATRKHLLNQDPPIDVILSHPIVHSGSLTMQPPKPSPDYLLVKFEVDDLTDDRGRAMFTFCFLHRSRLDEAKRRGFIEIR